MLDMIDPDLRCDLSVFGTPHSLALYGLVARLKQRVVIVALLLQCDTLRLCCLQFFSKGP